VKNKPDTLLAKARVLIVDDHPLLREGVAQLINRQSDLVASGEADTLAAAAVAIEQSLPEVVLLDLRFPSGDSLEFIKAIKSRFPQVRIVVLSQHEETLYAERSLRAGASGYVMKQEASEEVLNAIRTALSGELYLSRKMAPLVLRNMLRRTPATDGELSDLTDRELQVFQMLGAGLSSREMAKDLNLSVKTIETHRENLKQKLGIRTGAELVQRATKWASDRTASRSVNSGNLASPP